MRLVAFEQADGPHIGVITDRGVVDLSRLDPAAPRDLGTVIKTGQLDQIAALMAKAGDAIHHQIEDITIGYQSQSRAKSYVLG
jgi:hypothetical protein